MVAGTADEVSAGCGGQVALIGFLSGCIQDDWPSLRPRVGRAGSPHACLLLLSGWLMAGL